MYRKDSRAQNMRRRSAGDAWRRSKLEPPSTEGFVLDSVEIEAGKATAKADYLVNDTRMQIRLAAPLAPRRM